jgi:hypothetical protein
VLKVFIRAAQTEIRLSDIFDVPRKSFTIFYFLDRARWLPLALEAVLSRPGP